MSWDIRDFGASGDGVAICTTAVQSAIDACHGAGGGTLRVAGGAYVIGTIRLRSRVVLEIEAGASLLGSTDIADYAPDAGKQMYRGEPHMDRCLIFAEGAECIGITGRGTIDGRGYREAFPNPGDPAGHRPMLIRLIDCTNVRMRDVTLLNPASWTSAWLYCHDIAVTGLRIRSRANDNGDGLDFDGCTEVRVSDCSFDTSDDSICLQTSRPDRPCRDIVITNCIFRSRWAGIRIGLLSRGDFENVSVTGCIFRDIDDSGLKIQMCEGAAMRRMVFANLVMDRVPRPVFLTLCRQRACADAPAGVAPTGTIRDLSFNHIVADSSGCGRDSGIVISGLPGHPVSGISLSHIRLITGGGGTRADAERVPPEFDLEALGGHWPEFGTLRGPLPASGLFARHIRGLSLHDVRLETASADERPAMALRDVDTIA